MKSSRRILFPLGAFVSGAGCMYLFDPNTGRRRRALVRDQAIHASHKLTFGYRTTRSDLTQRAEGLVARARGLAAARKKRVSDRVLEARVRSQLGRLVSHPHAVRTEVSDGRVTLSGDVLASEVEALRAGVARVEGVHQVVKRLKAHSSAEGIPALQGGRVPANRPELLQENWAPAIRLLAAAAGAAIALDGVRRRGVAGAAMALAGTGLLARAVTNLETRRLLGLRARRGIDFQKTIHIEAPVSEVFRFFEEAENFPRFMRNVRSVERVGDVRYRWTVAGPAGTPVQFETVVARHEPNRLLAWRTAEGEIFGHAGTIRFERAGRDRTRVHVRMTYSPPAGVAGHAVATLLGANPKQEMTEDLVRMKSLIEVGKTSVPGRTVHREEVEPEART